MSVEDSDPTPLALKERMRAAWPADRVRRLGPLQRKRLSAWVAVDLQKDGDDYLTVPVLEGMLEMLETYFPEEIIGSPQVLAAKLKSPNVFSGPTLPQRFVLVWCAALAATCLPARRSLKGVL